MRNKEKVPFLLGFLPLVACSARFLERFELPPVVGENDCSLCKEKEVTNCVQPSVIVFVVDKDVMLDLLEGPFA